ncbi:uncharacterized protein TNCV_431701 [Trichonephila clavipes]|nr:uncharacterized protein TNCV_431701 [Trichonephila clavipes]
MIMISDESGFCLGSNEGRMLVGRRPGERLQQNCLWPRHTGPTDGVMVWREIYYDCRSTLVTIPNTLTANLHVSQATQPIVLPFMSSIQGRVFQQDSAHLHASVVTLSAYRSIDILPLLVRSQDLSPIEHVWDIVEQQLQHHPQPALTFPVLAQTVQQAGNFTPQSDI